MTTSIPQEIVYRVHAIEAVVARGEPLTKEQKTRYVAILEGALRVTKELFKASKAQSKYIEKDLETYKTSLTSTDPTVRALAGQLEAELTHSSDEEIAEMEAHVRFAQRVVNLRNRIEPRSTCSKILSYKKTLVSFGVTALAAAGLAATRVYLL